MYIVFHVTYGMLSSKVILLYDINIHYMLYYYLKYYYNIFDIETKYDVTICIIIVFLELYYMLKYKHTLH